MIRLNSHEYYNLRFSTSKVSQRQSLWIYIFYIEIINDLKGSPVKQKYKFFSYLWHKLQKLSTNWRDFKIYKNVDTRRPSIQVETTIVTNTIFLKNWFVFMEIPRVGVIRQGGHIWAGNQLDVMITALTLDSNQ